MNLFQQKKYRGAIKYFKNASWILVEKIFRNIIVLGVGILVINYLQPEKYGVMSYVLSFVGTVLPLATLGIRNIILRDLVDANQSTAHEILGTSMFINFSGAVLMNLVLLAVIPFFSLNQELMFLIFFAGIGLFFQLGLNIELYFVSQTQAKIVSICQVISITIASLFRVFLIYSEAPIIWFISAVSLEYLLTSVFLTIAYINHYGWCELRKWRVTWQMTKSLLSQSSYFVLATLATTLYLKIDQIMIRPLLGDESTGIYATAVKFSEGVFFVPIVICNSLMPAIVKAKNQGEVIYKRRLQHLFDLMFWGGLFLIIGIIIGAKFLLPMILSESYLPSIELLQIHIWSSIFVFIGIPSDKWLIVEKKYHISFYRSVIGAIVNICLNLYLIPLYGLLGATYATIISYCVGNYLSLLFIKGAFENFIMLSKVFTAPWRLFSQKNKW